MVIPSAILSVSQPVMLKSDRVIEDINENAKLSEQQMKLNKLGALFLFCSQGIIMIHEGQEYARSKVISTIQKIDDRDKRKLDHNSYNKDNETNYINYAHAELNKELVEYYKGLISLRKQFAAFRRADYENIHFFDIAGNPFAFAFEIIHDDERFFVAMNADQNIEFKIHLPEGEWGVLADNNSAGIKILRKQKNEVIIPAITGMILRKI